jgi:hypothetical protein
MSDGEVLLLRYPDRAGAKGKVIDRYDPDGGVLDLTLMRLIEPNDVLVEAASNHQSHGRVLRVVHDELEEIAPEFGFTSDLDGDGIPEIIATGDSGHDECGNEVGHWVYRWNGHEYLSDKRQYVAGARGDHPSFEFRIPYLSAPPKPKHYVLHVYRLHGAKSARVLIDGKEVAPERPIKLEDGCHTFEMKVTGRGAGAWALLEARPK